MNSRQQRRFRSYGMSNAEILESQAEYKKELEKACKDATKIFGLFKPYCPVDEHHVAVIRRAQQLYIVGKHAGSKSTYKLSKRIKTIETQIAKYTAAWKAAQKKRADLEVPAENVD